MRDRPERFLAVDVQAVQNPYHPERGIARYVREQSRALLQHGSNYVECFLANPKLGLVDGLEPLVASGALAWNGPEGPGGNDLASQPFVYYATSLFEIGMSIDDVWPRYVRRPDVLTAVTVYDLIPVIYGDHYLQDPAFRSRYEARLGLIRNADLVMTISETTADDVVRILGVEEDRVVNISTGVSETWRPPDPAEDPLGELKNAFPDIRPGYVFYTGGIDLRKNMERLLEAFSRLDSSLRARHQLVITCSMDSAGEGALRELIASFGIERDVLLTGFVPDEVLLRLYQAARLFVFPSLYEGFGLPLVEAIRCGAPAIASDRASMREILPGSEFRFDPEDPDGIASSVERALTDPNFSRRSKKAGLSSVEAFTWDQVAERTLAATIELWERRGPASPTGRLYAGASSRRGSRPRLAWFSPMPPQPSGIADYSARLLGELGRLADVDVFVDGSPSSFEEPTGEGVRLHHRKAFGFLDAMGIYDEVVYCMGNSEFHGHIYDALKERSGVVLAHEVRFAGFYAWYGANQTGDPGFFADCLARQHPNVAPALRERGWLSLEEAERYGVYLVSELIDESTRFLVHSEYAAEVARLQAGSSAEKIGVVPFGIPAPLEQSLSRTEASEPWVVTVGIAAEIKRTETFVRAMPLVLDKVPEVQFAVVGGFAPPQYREHIEEVAESLGVSDRLTITGYVASDEYNSWLERATCAVQLRSVTNGETSAAIGDCLRFGIPTIVTAMGPAREYPSDAVFPLRADATTRDVAAAIIEILGDSELQTRLSERGRTFARSSSFAFAAGALLSLVLRHSWPVNALKGC